MRLICNERRGGFEIEMKKVFLITALVLSLLVLSSCGADIEDEAAFLDEVAGLIESSYEINEIYFGEGLPMQTDGKTADEILAEADSEEGAAVIYLPVTEDSPYKSEDGITEAAAKVYSESYCAFLNQLAFEGISSDGKLVSYARYVTDFTYGLTVNVKSVSEAMELDRTYDTSTLELVRSRNGFWIGTSDYAVVSVDAYDGGVFAEKKEFKVVRDADGWRLDWPTY